MSCPQVELCDSAGNYYIGVATPSGPKYYTLPDLVEYSGSTAGLVPCAARELRWGTYCLGILPQAGQTPIVIDESSSGIVYQSQQVTWDGWNVAAATIPNAGRWPYTHGSVKALWTSSSGSDASFVLVNIEVYNVTKNAPISDSLRYLYSPSAASPIALHEHEIDIRTDHTHAKAPGAENGDVLEVRLSVVQNNLEAGDALEVRRFYGDVSTTIVI